MLNKLQILQLPIKYKHLIKNISIGLKKLICSKDYKFTKDFIGLEVETY